MTGDSTRAFTGGGLTIETIEPFDEPFRTRVVIANDG